MTTLSAGMTATASYVVTREHLATYWGSGAAAVLATPQMIAWMEAAAVAAVDDHLPEGYHTVGTLVEIRHLAASLPGAEVTVSATLVNVDDRQLLFEVEARDHSGIIGKGKHQRVIVHLERFEARALQRRV